MHDVVVVGAGPAGLHAARLLADRTLDVLVVEEHEEVGLPVHCTGIVARHAFDEFDLPQNTILNALDTARFVSPAGRDLVYRRGLVEAVVVDRRLFDQALARRAVEAGARLRCSTRVRAVKVDAHGVSLDTTAGDSIRGRVCVLACGGRYGLHRLLSLDRPGLLLHTAQAEIPAAHPGDVEMHFGSDAAPKGFAWAVPVTRGEQRYARVGVMSESDAPHHFSRMVHRIANRWGIDGAVPPPMQKILPLSAIARTYSDRVLAVGDAAGLVKPTTGGGIYYSLLSASLAADVLIGALEQNDLRAGSLAEYERRWRAHLDAELTTQHSLRLIAQRMSDGDIESLFELALTDGIMPIVRRTASFNRHRELILALFKHPPVRQLLLRSR